MFYFKQTLQLLPLDIETGKSFLIFVVLLITCVCVGRGGGSISDFTESSSSRETSFVRLGIISFEIEDIKSELAG